MPASDRLRSLPEMPSLLPRLSQKLSHLADGSLFLPIGRRQGSGLASSLRQKGFRVLRYVVYETLMVPNLPVAVENHLRHGQVGTAMFFSAEAARHFVRLVHAIGLERERKRRRSGVYQRTVSRGIKKAALASYKRRRTAKPGCDAGVTEMSDQPAPPPTRAAQS